MAQTPSTMLALGTTAPPFSLPEPATGKTVALADFSRAPALLVIFLCNHCPFVKHVRAGLAQLARDVQRRGVVVIGINANDPVGYQADSPTRMVEEVAQAGYTFPYLFDERQEVAKAYRAACTPDFFLFDDQRCLVYRGQLDDSRPGNGLPVTGRDLRQAVEAVLTSAPPPAEQRPSIGCNIKWRPGNEPDYYAS